MTQDERAYLECFTPETYGMEIPRSIAQPMERLGWIEWMPPKFSTTLWAITETGKEALRTTTPNKHESTTNGPTG